MASVEGSQSVKKGTIKYYMTRTDKLSTACTFILQIV
jgi:hypothetical protein